MFYFSRRAKASGRVGAALTIAALTLSLAQPIMLLALPSLARAVTVETIFEDGFESGNFDAWTLVENKWFINTTNAHSGTKKVNVQGSTTGDNSLIKDQSTVGYENLNLEYWYKADAESLEEGDQVIVEYTINGTDWVELLAIIDGVDDGEWHEDSHDLPVEANNNSDFAIRFRANLDAGNDTVRLDDVKLTGEALPLPGSIAGFKYHDEDANGEQGEGEDGLEDWEIALYDENGVNVMATTSTDSDGNFEFADVTPGNYRVCEVKTFPVGPHEPWWIQTEPAEDEESECFDGWRGYDVMVAEGEEVSEGIIFGNAEGAVIGGWKYADPDADGEHEDESDGVPGFTINLYQNDELLATKQTLDHPEQPGQYYFERLWPGEYLICEEQQSGWVQTGPTTTDATHPLCDNEGTVGHLVTVVIGEWNYENHFHNRELPDVTGPRVEITSLTDGDIINGEVDIAGIIADANPGHYWLRIEDATSTAVNFSGGPGTVAQLISYDTETHLFTWDTDSLDGEYWIKLEARDSLGNKNPNLSPVPEGVAYPDATTTDSVHWIKVIVDEDYVPPSDETPPPLPIHLSPLDGTIRNTLGLILDFTDVLDDMSNPVTYYYQSAHDGATTTDNAFLTPIWNSALLSISENDGVGSPEAKYWWHVRACDTAGNCSLWTDAWTLTVDNTAPTTTITSPNPDSTFDSSILVEGYTNDNVGVGTTTLSSAIYDGEVCGTYADITVLTGVASTTFNWSYDWTPAEDGTYCIKGAGTDLAGNEEGSAIIFPVTYKKSVTPPPAPPEEEDDDGGGSSGGCYNCGGGSSIGGSTTTEETFGEGGDNPILALGALGQLPPRNEATGPINDGEENLGDDGDDTATTTSTSTAGVVAGSPLVAATGNLLLDWWWLILLVILAGIAGWWYWRKYKEEGTSSPRQPEQPMF